MSDEGIKARLVAAREQLGLLELEGLRAIQSAQRCISRGVPDVDLERALCAEDPTMLREAARRVRRLGGVLRG